MIGESYFEARERLSGCLDSLKELGERAGVSADRLASIQGLKARLREPFLLVVAGDPSSGRATFLEGMFGEEFVRLKVEYDVEDEVEKTVVPRVQYFRYGDEARDLVTNDSLVECYRPCEFLKDFHIIHVPVTLKLLENSREVVDRYIPLADLTFFMFACAVVGFAGAVASQVASSCDLRVAAGGFAWGGGSAGHRGAHESDGVEAGGAGISGLCGIGDECVAGAAAGG